MAYSNKFTKEEEKRLAQEKVRNSFAKIHSDVVSIFDKEALPAFLELMARLHYFDAYNLVLIYKQCPTASYVAPFKTWEAWMHNYWHDPARAVFLSSQQGRGIGILAPYVLKKKLSDVTNMRTAAIASRVVSYLEYHAVFVFDKSQTSGIPAPEIDWDLAQNELHAEAAFHAFKSVAPFNVVFSEDSNFRGNFVFEEHKQNTAGKSGDSQSGSGTNESARRDSLVLNAKHRFDYVALCNFIVRYFVAQSMKKVEAKVSPDEFERITECVSFVVASHFGLATSDYSFFFARNWLHTPKEMLDTLTIIQSYAHTLINNIEAEMVEYVAQFGDIADVYAPVDALFDFEELSLFP